jgi:hypothetical protein
MRYGSAAALLVAVSLVSAPPIWHHGHHSTALAVAEDADHNHDIHLCSTGGHATPTVNCPICLSQRLLNHGDFEATPLLTAPVLGATPQVAWHVWTPISIFHDARPRAPPTI